MRLSVLTDLIICSTSSHCFFKISRFASTHPWWWHRQTNIQFSTVSSSISSNHLGTFSSSRNWREEKEFYFHLISFLSSSHLVVWEHEPTSTSSYISLTAIFPIEFNERGLYLNILFLWDFPICRPFLLVGPCTEHPCTLSAHRMADRGSHNSKRIVSLEKWKEWIP